MRSESRGQRAFRAPARPARFAAAGVLLHVVALACVSASFSRRGGPAAIGVCVLAVVVAAGIVGMLGGTPDRIARRVRQFTLGAPGPAASREPWLWDHDWTARGEEVRIGRTRVASHAAVLAIGLTLTTVIVVAGGFRRAPEAAAFLTLLTGVPTTISAWRLLASVGRGLVRVGFTRVPYAPGEVAQITVGCGPTGPGLRKLSYSLRHIVERPDRWASEGTACVATRCIFPRTDGVPREIDAGADVLLVFDLPGDLPGTMLRANQPSYWMLFVRGTLESEPFLARFLVPIYRIHPGRAPRRTPRRAVSKSA